LIFLARGSIDVVYLCHAREGHSEQVFHIYALPNNNTRSASDLTLDTPISTRADEVIG
jgi:hypothetical protein